MRKNDFLEYAKTYTAIPVYRYLMADTFTPVSLFLRLRKDAGYPFLFESVEGGEHLARYSFLGCNPYQVLKFTGDELLLEKRGQVEKLDGDYFEVLKKLTDAYTEPDIPDLPRLTSGAVGFSGYDTVRQVETLPEAPTDDLKLPEAVWGFYDEIYAFDHVKQQIILVKTVLLDQNGKTDEELSQHYESAVAALDQMELKTQSAFDTGGEIEVDTDSITSNLNRHVFEENVRKARHHIYEGDIFQVVLSQRFEAPYSGDNFMFYRALRMVNPSPYLFYLDFEDFALVGSSPEVLVRVQNNRAEVLPIAGTRRRGRDREEDKQLEEELLNDPKEIAEHVMLLDLGRNDLARVCDPASVEVVRNQTIERYSHVMHIVSEVAGDLAADRNAVDALMQCFPAGTVSGAPKIRAMEIINELEPTKRGPYAGAVGYFDFRGNMDTCIAIRTMVVTGEKVFIQAGAGIVADSDANQEFKETQNKADALIESLRVALSLTQQNKEMNT